MVLYTVLKIYVKLHVEVNHTSLKIVILDDFSTFIFVGVLLLWKLNSSHCSIYIVKPQ